MTVTEVMHIFKISLSPYDLETAVCISKISWFGRFVRPGNFCIFTLYCICVNFQYRISRLKIPISKYLFYSPTFLVSRTYFHEDFIWQLSVCSIETEGGLAVCCRPWNITVVKILLISFYVQLVLPFTWRTDKLFGNSLPTSIVSCQILSS